MEHPGLKAAQELPTELWTKIIEVFDSHELYWNQSRSEQIRCYKNDVRQLAIFCRVSKHFNDIALPLLYRDVRLFGGDLRLFVRTMECRRKELLTLEPGNLRLRGFIDRLSLEFPIERGMFPQPSDADKWSLQRCYEEAIGGGMGWHVTDMEWPTVHQAAEHENGWHQEALNEGTGPNEDLAVILLFWLPAIRYLRFAFEKNYDRRSGGIDGIWKCKRLLQTMSTAINNDITLETLREGDPRMMLPAALINLEELVMPDPFPRPWTHNEDFPPPEIYRNFSQMKPFWSFPGLRRLTLAGFRMSDIGPLPQTLSTVEDLALEACHLDPEECKVVLSHFPGVRTLHFQVKGMHMVPRGYFIFNHDNFRTQDSRSVVAAISTASPGLETLEFLNIASHVELAEEIESVSMMRQFWRGIGRGVYGQEKVEQESEDNDDDDSSGDDLCTMTLDSFNSPNPSPGSDTEAARWIRFRNGLSRYLGTVDLRPFSKLRQARLHITDFDGWVHKTHVERYVSPPRISQVLPSSIESLTLLFTNLGGGGEGGNDACTAIETNFESVEALILDCRQLCDRAGSALVPKLRQITLEIRDCRCCDDTHLEVLHSSARRRGIALQVEKVPLGGPKRIDWGSSGKLKAHTARRLACDREENNYRPLWDERQMPR